MSLDKKTLIVWGVDMEMLQKYVAENTAEILAGLVALAAYLHRDKLSGVLGIFKKPAASPPTSKPADRDFGDFLAVKRLIERGKETNNEALTKCANDCLHNLFLPAQPTTKQLPSE